MSDYVPSFPDTRRALLKLIRSASAIAAGCALSACHTRGAAHEHTAKAASSGSAEHAADRIQINEHGFEPSHVIVEDARPLIFRRTTDQSCATAVVFPQFKIEASLPLNTDVSVVLPPTASGELAFQCGIGENRGKVVANVAGS